MDTTDTLSLILLNLCIDELKNLKLNKQTESILNSNDFWSQWLSKYNIHTTKNCKYIALNYHFDENDEENYEISLKKSRLPIAEYFLDNREKYDWFDMNETVIEIIGRQHDSDLLKLLMNYFTPTENSIVFTLAYKSYDMLEILLLHDDNVIEPKLKTKILHLITCIHDYKFLDPVRIKLEDIVDDLFEPYTAYTDDTIGVVSDFWQWRSDYLY